MTNDESRCAFYKAESQNVKAKYYCNPPEKYRDELAKKMVGEISQKFPYPRTNARLESFD